MSTEPTRFDREINVNDSRSASTTRFDRIAEADLEGIRTTLEDGRTALCFKWVESGHVEAALTCPTRGRYLWGRFSGVKSAILQLSDAVLGNVEGEFRVGPVVESPSVFETYLRDGGTAVVVRADGLYRVSLYRKSSAKKQRRGGRDLMIATSTVRRSQSDDIFVALDEALRNEGTSEEVIQL
jgi:hypothetical protein